MASHAALTSNQLQAIGWSFCGVAIVLSITRFTIRLTLMRKLLLDDVFHFLALACFIGMLAVYQYLFPDLAEFTLAEAGQAVNLSPQALNDLWKEYRALQLAGVLLYITGLWMVKAAYLTLYYIIFSVSKTFRISLWFVATCVFLTWWAVAFGIITQCGTPSQWSDIQACQATSRHKLTVEGSWTGTLSALTDLMVLVLPLFMIRKLHVSLAQKLSLTLTFSLGLIVVVLDIVRAVKSVKSNDFSLSTAYQFVVIGIAVIISSFPVFRAFLSPAKRQELSTAFSPLFYSLSRSRRRLDDAETVNSQEQFKLRDMSGESSRNYTTYSTDEAPTKVPNVKDQSFA